MELRAGYKKTEVGLIPDDWAIGSLESVTHQGIRNGIVDGPFGSNLKTIHYRKSGVPIVTSGYVTDGHFYADSYLYVDPEKFRAEKRSAVSPGDIVMAKIGARCGASAILPASHPVGILSGNALKISVDESRHSTFYVWQVLWDLYLDGRMDVLRTVGAQPAISMANLKKHQIPLPPQTEQRAIAIALSDVDALLAKIDQLIAKKRDLKQAAMQRLLTGQTRLPGFSGEWEVKRLGDVANLYQPLTISAKQFTASGYPVYGANGVVGFFDDFNHESPQVTVTCRGSTCGTVNRTVARSWITGNAMVINCDQSNGINKDFLYYLLLNQDLSICITGSGQPQIVRGPLANFELQLPCDLTEQTAIAAVLSDMDAELVALEARRDKTRALKQGMMQALLTGRIRLV